MIRTTNTIHNFDKLDLFSKGALYQEANETHNVDLVRELNEKGMKPEAPVPLKPSFISSYMDIATKHDLILGFFKELRQTGKLLTEMEFQELPPKKWIRKSNLSRLLGCDHLIQLIKKRCFKHIKTPEKKVVIQGSDTLEIMGYDTKDGLYDLQSKQITIYADKIKSIERKLSIEEIDEFIQTVDEANFVDLNPENIVVAEDGLYFIDTEFKSFAGTVHFGKMGRFECFIDIKDRAYFRRKVTEKMEEKRPIKEINEYGSLVDILEMLSTIPDPPFIKMEELRAKINKLRYVGLEKAGSAWYQPNKFSFNLKDIL